MIYKTSLQMQMDFKHFSIIMFIAVILLVKKVLSGKITFLSNINSWEVAILPLEAK